MSQNGSKNSQGLSLEQVLELAKNGFKVHPLVERDKLPILGSWQTRASSEEGIIRSWYSSYPHCNWGILTGEPSGIFVVDLDVKAGGDQSWDFLIDENGVPETWSVRTGGGGQHLYFKWPKGKEIYNSSNRIGRGIDIRATNGQVVAPGSIHPNGTPYSWERAPGTVPLAKPPKWLIDLITDESIEEYAAIGGPLEKGTRNNSIYHNALSFARQGVSEDFTFTAVMKWLDDQGRTDVDQDEVRKTIASAYKAAKAKPIELSEMSDTMNAEVLINQHGDDLLYTVGIGWFHWNGKIWEPDNDEAIISQLFISCMKVLREEAGQRMAAAKSKAEVAEAAKLAAWAVKSLSARAISAAISLAGTFPKVRRDPDDIDSVSTQWLLNCQNGTVDLRTGELRPHEKTDYITKITEAEYKPEATAPFWEETIQLIFEQDEEMVGFIQRALGYSITGSQDEKCFFICHGEGGNNGKSTVFETVQRVLGKGYSQMSDVVVVTSKTVDNRVAASLAKLKGSRFVNMNEAEDGQKLSDSLIKQITGGDMIQAKSLYLNPFEYRPIFKLWMRTNELPIIRTQNEAFWTRVKRIPFTKTIPPEKILPRSEVDRRLDEEASGILTWLIKGTALWIADGHLIEPKKVADANADYRNDSDIVRTFMEECLVEDAGSTLQLNDVYQIYVGWSKEAGERWIMSKTKFTQRLKKIPKVTTDRGSRGATLKGYKMSMMAQNYAM